LKEKLIGILTLLRPAEWSKSFGNMVMAWTIAMFLATGTVDLSIPSLQNFVIAFIAVGPLLWGGLYALNDWTDIEKDKAHPVKRKRPLPSGVVKPIEGLLLALGCIILAFAIGFFLVNTLFVICLGVMLINQLLYTIPPIKLKERPVLDLVSGSLVNPAFRFFSGWVLIMPHFNAPILFLLFILGVQFGGYTLYRLSGKKIEKQLQYKSSVTVFGAGVIKIISYLAIAIGALSYILATLADFFPAIAAYGGLPFHFLLYGLVMLLPLPFYGKAMKDPEQADITKMYFILYTHYTLFILGFILMFLV
jgi:4-hydroxybenzoate polyprenyltransferase